MHTPIQTKTVDCAVRTLLTQTQYDQLRGFFVNVAQLKCDEVQETRYFEGENDLRIQRGAQYAYIWLKKPSVDGTREEIKIRVAPQKFGDFEKLFDSLGYQTAIIWLRHRLDFTWDDVAVSLDHTKGYGYVLELGKKCDEAWRLETMDVLREKLAMLGLKPTAKPVLHERFGTYRANWRTLIMEGVSDMPVAAEEAPIAALVMEPPAALPVEVAASEVETVIEVTLAPEAAVVPEGELSIAELIIQSDEALETSPVAVLEEEPVIRTMHEKTPA